MIPMRNKTVSMFPLTAYPSVAIIKKKNYLKKIVY